ncbi:MAG: 2,3,4,5-tetrahydropyridine-2,6-dicarboxylate N-succinyltransferase [Deltaproteobacteria bacterium]|nr:2,3,4,5-tetrahydropyridine-2,6-dicarboxylate N-succinyltransferase [Deltaproteobacteria bacterium]
MNGHPPSPATDTASHDELLIRQAFADRSRLLDPATREAIRRTLSALDDGTLRVASPPDPADPASSSPEGAAPAPWTVHTWVKEAVLLYFAIQEMVVHELPPFEWYDKVPLKTDFKSAGVRAVPPATVRFGAHVEPGCILMPSYVNIGARVGQGTMVDTWATVGSCAQVGKHVHLSGGVGLGGVLEPASATPVIIEDGAFLGSRVIVVEGVRVGREAVLGAGVILASSTRIIDVTGPTPVETRGYVPPRSVVIPGTVEKSFPAGNFHVPVALVIGRRSASTDQKTSLNAALRDFGVTV